MADLFVFVLAGGWLYLCFLSWKGYQCPPTPLGPVSAFFYTFVIPWPFRGWWKLWKHNQRMRQARIQGERKMRQK